MAIEQPAVPDPQVQQVSNGDGNIVVGAGNVTINNLRSPVSSLERRPLEILLDRVEQFWIKGVLQGSVHGAALFELGKEALPEVVEHPWEKVLEVPGQAVWPLPSEYGIGEVFEQVGRFLLVLGEPGAGKTITLLDLARELLARARSDWSQPVPVVFNLSTWATGKKPLAEWLIDEMKGKYFVSRPIAETWLEQSLLLPLLDGLDEVESDSQGACVEAINAFVQSNGPPGLAVCSRSAEYVRLPVRLKLNGAVRLLALTSEQITDYLQKAEPRLAALEAALHGDPGLQKLAQSPLMLSVMALAYQDVPLAAMANRRRTAADVFSTYIDRMFERKGKGQQPYSKEATVTWLSWLARVLQTDNQTVFLVEQLQPTWLKRRAQLWWYVLVSRLLVGTAVALGIIVICRVNAGLIPGLLLCGALQGLGAALLDGYRFERWRSRGSTAGLGWVLAQVVAVASIMVLLSDMPMWRDDNSMVWVFSLACGLLFGLRARRTMVQDILTVETLTWSWRRALKRGLWCFVAGLFVALIILIWTKSMDGCLGEIILMFGLIMCGIGVLFGALYGGLAYGILEAKTRPNQGILLSARNAGLAGLGVGTSLGTLVLLSLWAYGAGSVSFSLMAALFCGLISFFGYGGIDVLQHAALRFVLWRAGDAPLDYPRFLDHAAKLIFLQKVGGGYIFMHRRLLEHFAALEQ